MIPCSACGRPIGSDEEVSIMQINTQPGGRVFSQYNLCEKCHYKIMEFFSSSNKVNQMANKG